MTSSDAVPLELLQRFEIFDGLEQSELRRLSTAVERTTFEPGERLIVEGETTRRLYAVLEGRVEVLKADDSGERRRLAVLEGETVLGEHGFVLAEPRTATIRALDTVDTLDLEGRAFDELDEEHGEIARQIEYNILRMLAHRQTEINRELLVLLDETARESTYHCDETNDLGDQLMRRWTV